MRRLGCLLVLLVGTAVAAPVPKEKADPVPDGALVRLGKLRLRGPHLTDLTFSSDGKMLLATDGKATVVRWDAVTGRPLEPIVAKADGVWCSWLAADRLVMVRPVRVGKEAKFTLDVAVQHFTRRDAVEFSTEWVLNREPAPGDRPRLLLTGGRWLHGHHTDRKKVFDTDDGTQAVQLHADVPESDTVRLTADGKSVFARKADGVLHHPLEGGREPLHLKADFPVTEFALTPDEKSVVAIGAAVPKTDTDPGGTPVAVWEVAKGGISNTFTVPDGTLLLSAVGDTFLLAARTDDTFGRTFHLDRWDLATGEKKWTAKVPMWGRVPEGEGLLVRLSADGKRVVVSNGEHIAAVYDAATGKRTDAVPAHDDHVQWVGFSADGKTVTTAGNDGVRTWNAESGEPLSSAAPGDSPHVFWGVFAGLPVWKKYIADPADATVSAVAWDVSAGMRAWEFAPKLGGTCPAGVFGDRLLVGLPDRRDGDTVVVFDQNRKEVARWKAPPHVSVTSLEDSAVRVGDDLVIKSEEEKNGERFVVRLSLADGKVVKKIGVPLGKTDRHEHPRAVSADGTLLALYGASEGWAVVDLPSGQLVSKLPGERKHLGPFAISPDGKTALIADGSPTVRLVPVARPERAKTFTGSTPATAVAFSPDGTRIAVGYRDGTALIWDVSK